MLLLAALQGTGAPAFAAARQQEITDLFPARPSGFVTDPAGVIDPGSARRIEQMAVRLRERTGAEIATVVLPTIGRYAPVDVAVAIGRSWGVGARAEIGDVRRNTGLVILLVPRNPDDDNSGHIFIAPGQGLEGIVTDLQAGRTRDVMLPFLRDRRYGEGLAAGVERLVALIESGMGVPGAVPPAGAAPAGKTSVVTAGLVIFVFIVIAMIVMGQVAAQRRGMTPAGRRRRRRGSNIFWGGGWGGGGFGGGGFGGGGFGGGGFGGFGGGGGFSGGGAGGRF